MQTMTTLPTIQIRVAGRDDDDALLRLAALDSAPAPHGEVLVAVIDGEVLAALALDSGRAIADPFRHTADLVELLHTRAHLMGDRGSEYGRKRLSLRRLASPIALAR
jgi:hypothetical protein